MASRAFMVQSINEHQRVVYSTAMQLKKRGSRINTNRKNSKQYVLYIIYGFLG